MVPSSSSSISFLPNLGFGFESRRNENYSITRRNCFSKEQHIVGSEKKLERGTTQEPPLVQDSIPKPSSQISQNNGFPPLVGALKHAAEQTTAGFHFPGHNRGRAAPPSLTQLIGSRPFIHDLPELPELDNLFSPEGPILEAQRQAAELFGSSETWFLVGGTTCGIQAAIMATCSPKEYLVLPRNSHISAFSAMVLSGAMPKYILPEYDNDWDIAGGVTSLQLDTALKELEMESKKASAVFITSPTYHGICSDLNEISNLCHSCGVPLIVDEAHGAHLGFHPKLPQSALQQGADVVVQSTHKVLCSLTQSSMLHLLGNIVDRERICRCLQTLQSTSPSYLLLASLDAARAQINENPVGIFSPSLDLAFRLRNQIKNIQGISIFDFPSFSGFAAVDPLRLTTGFWGLGLSGYEADTILESHHKILCELVGTKSMTFAINIGTCQAHIERLVSALEHLSENSASVQNLKKFESIILEPYTDIVVGLNPRDAFFVKKRKVKIRESLGKVSGELICTYPPGIPAIAPGEIITESALDYLLHAKEQGATITGASDPQLSSIQVCDL